MRLFVRNDISLLACKKYTYQFNDFDQCEHFAYMGDCFLFYLILASCDIFCVGMCI